MIARQEIRATGMLVALVMGCGQNAKNGVDSGIDMDLTPRCPTCQLLAVAPALASANQTINLEGTFADPVVVNFPGGISQSATMLGPHRATVIVPDTATTGDLTVTAGGSLVGPLEFRRVSFTPEIGTFQGYAGTTTARAQPAIAAVGNRLYAIGGSDSVGALTTIEEAIIGADGSVGAFTASSVGLTTGRIGARAKRIGDYLYVVGGADSVERAAIHADGSLGPFAALPDVHLLTARANLALAVVGNYLYVMGGAAPETSTRVERAAIGVDGSLGAFEVVPDVTTAAGRVYFSAEVIGSYLYVLGGINIQSQNSVERAKIAADGTLGRFENAEGCTLSSGRDRVASVRIAGDLYAVGGQAPSAPFTIERASIDASGTLGTFSLLTVHMSTSHKDSTGVVIGDYLYVLGGLFGTASVERAPINAAPP